MPAAKEQKKLKKQMNTLQQLWAQCRQMRAELEDDPVKKAKLEQSAAMLTNPVGAPQTSRLKQTKNPFCGGQVPLWRRRKPRARKGKK